jgi:hypothetical protein
LVSQKRAARRPAGLETDNTPRSKKPLLKKHIGQRAEISKKTIEVKGLGECRPAAGVSPAGAPFLSFRHFLLALRIKDL